MLNLCRFSYVILQLPQWLRPSHCVMPCCEEKPPPSQINSLMSTQVKPPLPDQLPGKHTGGATPSQINSLGNIQVEPPPPRLTPWETYRWSHPLRDKLPGEHTGSHPKSTFFSKHACVRNILRAFSFNIVQSLVS